MSGKGLSGRMQGTLMGHGGAWRPRPPKPQEGTPLNSSGAVVRAVGLPDPLGKNERGTVWSDLPQSWFPGGTTLTPSAALYDEISLRTALLFVDRIDVPTTSMFGYPSPAKDALTKLGVGQSTRIAFDGDMASGLALLPVNAFIQLDEREPGRWSMTNSPDSLEIPAQALDPGQGFAIDLQHALPVFSREVAFDDVLEFKKKRFDELLALRHHMDDLCLTVTRLGANSLAGSSSLERFDKALADHIKVMEESNLHKVYSSLRQNISWPDIVAGGTMELMLGHALDAKGLIPGAISLAVKTASGLLRRKSASPFEYLTSANRELY